MSRTQIEWEDADFQEECDIAARAMIVRILGHLTFNPRRSRLSSERKRELLRQESAAEQMLWDRVRHVKDQQLLEIYCRYRHDNSARITLMASVYTRYIGYVEFPWDVERKQAVFLITHGLRSRMHDWDKEFEHGPHPEASLFGSSPLCQQRSHESSIASCVMNVECPVSISPGMQRPPSPSCAPMCVSPSPSLPDPVCTRKEPCTVTPPPHPPCF